MLPIKRPAWFTLCNRVGRLAESLGVRPFELQSSRILARARRAGRFDFRDDAFEEGLEQLIRSLRDEARLTAFGKFAMRNAVQRSANSRFQVERAISENPAILDEPINDPVFIIGMPRSGTTILQAMLHRDAAHRSPLCWECLLPYPAPTPETYRNNRRLDTIRREFEIMFRLVPDLRKKHYMAADAPQECVGITALNFCSYQYLAQADLPSYDHWLADEADQLQNLRWHKRFLQFLQSGGIRPVRWLLKSPLHLLRVKELFEVYPDARIVMPHRQPSRFLASVASLIASTRSLYTDHRDPVQYGRALLQTWGRYLDRFLRDRETLDRENNFVDFHFDDFVHNQMGIVETIYERYGWRLDPHSRARMEEFLRRERKDKHGVHTYSLEQFGIAPADIDREFSGYNEFLRELKAK
ncbi:MAG: sulfotransferase [Rhodospirillaceae bacterium]|nr:sulfotransferase [Rhodospirillaceae bacterium]MDD9999873.1 sulfotransferase [Rhodospirillaceae bacterium]MDE0363527.1 sulfotransferase [Rhodospirillaceae bacterium]